MPVCLLVVFDCLWNCYKTSLPSTRKYAFEHLLSSTYNENETTTHFAMILYSFVLLYYRRIGTHFNSRVVS